jgi:hypothetical protein
MRTAPGRTGLPRNRLGRGLGVVVVVLGVAGCASAGDPGDAPPSAAVADGYLCDHVSISREAMETRVSVGAIDDAGRAALAEARWDDGSPVDLPPEEDWYLAAMTDDLVGVMRDIEVVPDPSSMGLSRDHELLTVERVDDATNLAPGWYVGQSGTCALTVDLGDLTVPEVQLQSPPDSRSTEVALLVTEVSCNSGEDAAGRIEVVSLDETDDTVSLILGVRPRNGAQNCPSNPATPFTVTLSHPLGERQVMDASLADPRPLTVNE